MAGVLRVLQDLVLLIVRVCLGGLLVLHGWRRWQMDGMQRQIDYLTQFHTPYPVVMAWGATILEMVGGVFLVFGLLTPLVALAFVVEQVMIVAWARWFRGPFVDRQGWEYNVALACLSLIFVVFGAGRAAMDQLFKRSRDDADEQYVGRPGGSTSYADRDPA